MTKDASASPSDPRSGLPGIGSPGHLVTRSPCQPLTIALVGNPNTGKTTLFNALASMRQRTGNYPGVTVETKKGQMTVDGQVLHLIDLPGTYSLAPRSPDEMVAVDVLLGQQVGEPRPDAVIALADASNLERNLYLTTQVMELGDPVVVALNMVDVAAAQGIHIDAEKLARQLGVSVVPIQAHRRVGLEQLKRAVAAAVAAKQPGPTVAFPEAFEREAAALHAAVGPRVPDYLVRRLLVDVGGYTETRLAAEHGNGLADEVRAARARLAAAGCGVPGVEARTRYAWIRQATAGCIRRPERRPVTWTDRVDKILTHRVWGTLAFLALMFVVFQSIFTAATPLMDLIDGGVGALADLITTNLPPGPLTSLLAEGIVGGVGSVIIFLPQIVILFGFIAVLEDCGYMARAAFLMDRLMARCGLSGKSFIPLLSSMACAVPGILATRVIENRRDRLATILVAPLMSCSARLPLYVLLIGAFLTVGYAWWVPGLTMFALYALGLVIAPLVALTLKRTLLRGETPVFLMEMPTYKWPSLRTVLGRMTDAGGAFLRRAGTMILASMVLVWALLYFPHTDAGGVSYEERIAAVEEGPGSGDEKQEEVGRLRGEWKRNSLLGRVGRMLEPAFRPLGWDWKVGTAALASFPAREVVVGTLGLLYNQGDVDPGEVEHADDVAATGLGQALRAATWDDAPERKVFTAPAALSLLVFFALCCQCVSTLAVIRRETNSWAWPAFTFVYMTVLAYVGALVVFQVGSRLP